MLHPALSLLSQIFCYISDGKDASRRPSLSSVHSTSSLVKRAVNAMPQTVDRIKYLK